MSKSQRSNRATNNRRTIATQPASANQRSLKKSVTAVAVKKSKTRKPGKIEKIIAMLRRPNGAKIGDLAKATNWQVHSVRGAISGTIKKKCGLTVTSEKIGTVRLYRIAERTAG